MKVPINFLEIEDFKVEFKCFDITKKALVQFLENAYQDNSKNFIEDYYNDLHVVLNDYKFENESISFSRSYSYNPPLDYITISIRIYDMEDIYVGEYRAFYDLEFKMFDDKIRV
ncbi:hypothetical protein AN639_06480 [Candidatus Epulonipiscium fishelsonii]|uniref:Uncharacterized protein n=1 Tax=Candidatus Epulonipiscium fishelsonii TaxID=77094 RepID=A0ACC8XFW7_9FIRM|nr:hypothetical protein AN639_06480 [Epulopiscium sp. SCG-B05WGA-EpuloA1]ONI42248.1 hypothetical protein AN396_02000 [Epulopiscium sp. SCG-B11WGA-EpuloA1]